MGSEGGSPVEKFQCQILVGKLNYHTNRPFLCN